ncbi:MAG: hypothetical protein HYY55_04465 [Candidatus Niyogibacteria bacterium]|nr:MAG: hypothetical protein HYY55_04465 [Candidatus Niyogibacteria bacterium]
MDFLNAAFWSKIYTAVQDVLAILSFIFLAVSIFVFVKIWPLRQRLYVFEGHRANRAPQKQVSFEDEQRRANRRKWDAIIKKAETAGSRGYPMAIIEADILLEDVMGRMGFLGKNLAERLRSLAPGELPSSNSVWEAHKLRNKIAHEPDFHPSREETTRTLGAYKKALEELKVI